MVIPALTLGVSAVLVLIDFFIKQWAQTVLQPVTQIQLIPNVLSLYYHQNYGAAWGIFQGKRWFLLAITAVVLGGLIAGVLLKKFQGRVMLTAMCLIIGGGVGNLIDRTFNPGGYVVDYIYFEPINFPIFNFADCCVVCGTFLLAFYILFWEGKAAKSISQEQSDLPEINGEEQP